MVKKTADGFNCANVHDDLSSYHMKKNQESIQLDQRFS